MVIVFLSPSLPLRTLRLSLCLPVSLLSVIETVTWNLLYTLYDSNKLSALEALISVINFYGDY